MLRDRVARFGRLTTQGGLRRRSCRRSRRPAGARALCALLAYRGAIGSPGSGARART